jgi:hypothetical protein
MTNAYVYAQDATSPNESHIPASVLAAGYDTGSSGIAWTPAQFAARKLPYPAIHIDQDPNASDPTADILDVEARAATPQETVGWLQRARADYLADRRPGQRWPGIYCSMNTIDPVVGYLTAAKLTDVPFWTAQPGLGVTAAIARVLSATGPYPCVGVQYEFGTAVDYNVFSLNWVTQVSGVKVPTTGTQVGWRWCHKCQGLFYGPNVKKSVCPAGGAHDSTGSGNYELTDVH